MVVLITVLISSSTILEYLNQDSRHRSYVERKRLEEYREFAIDIIEKNYPDQIKNPLSEEQIEEIKSRLLEKTKNISLKEITDRTVYQASEVLANRQTKLLESKFENSLARMKSQTLKAAKLRCNKH